MKIKWLSLLAPSRIRAKGKERESEAEERESEADEREGTERTK